MSIDQSKLKKFAVDPDLALFGEVADVNEKLKTIVDKEGGVQKVEIAGAELVTIKGQKGEKGDKGDRGEKGDSVRGERGLQGIQGERGVKGEKGDRGERGERGIQGEDGIDGEDGKDASPDAVDEIKNEIRSLKEELKKVERVAAQTSSGGGTRRIFQPYRDDFSSQTNGVTKTFYLSREPLKTDTIMIFGTDFPIILRPTIDFTVSGKNLTLTSAVPAPSSGATLLVIYFA